MGSYISDLIGVPAAYVTSGAGSALTLAAAAVMAGDNDDFIQQLPNTSGMKNEILIQKRQRYWYDRCLEASGASLVEFGSETGTSKDDLIRAIGPNTAAVHFYMVEQENDPLALSLPEVIEIAHENSIPVLVDAAGQIYPLENFGKYVKLGADFQCIAAKYMGASQSTGLALGTEDMIRKSPKGSSQLPADNPYSRHIEVKSTSTASIFINTCSFTISRISFRNFSARSGSSSSSSVWLLNKLIMLCLSSTFLRLISANPSSAGHTIIATSTCNC